VLLRNERSLGLKNGGLGTIEQVDQARVAVRLDDGRVTHGYAATIHKSQGVTVYRVHLLVTPVLDRHAAYVALSRHRDAVQLHYGCDDFADQGKLARTPSRDRPKDNAPSQNRSDHDKRGGIPHRRRNDVKSRRTGWGRVL